MAEAVRVEIKSEPHAPVTVRRFSIADLSQHGAWILRRLQILFPDMPEQWIGGWMRGLIWNNEHLFLYQDHAVSLAQIVHSPGIKTTKVVQERFVWVENREDKEQLALAADFYTHMKVWAGRQGAERIVVCESSDVPKSLIEARLGRLFDTKISHARV